MDSLLHFFIFQSAIVVIYENQALSLVPTCPRNRKNWEFLRFSDVWDSYDQWEHRIPDSQWFLRHDRKNSKHLYFESPSQTFPDVDDFHHECEHEICLSGTSGILDFVFLPLTLDFQWIIDYKCIILSTADKL